MSNIEKILGHYELSANSQDKLCCPFHQEDTPSFTIYPETDSWFCWGKCGVGGDMIAFVRKMEDKLTFKEAKAKVEEITGVTLGDVKDAPVKKKEESHPPLPNEVLREFANNTVYQDKNYRGIRKEVDEFFKTRTKLDSDGNVVARYYMETQQKDDGEYQIVGIRCRNHPKDFTYGHIGKVGGHNALDGEWKFKGGGKYVLLVGGQEDKHAAYQMLLDYSRERNQEGFSVIPVVSPTSGEGSAHTQVARRYDWLDGYDNIVIGMDNDGAGRKAAEEIAKVLPKEKVRIVTWSGKDPNDMLNKGMQKQFIRDFYNAKDYVETGIKSSSEADDELEIELGRAKIPLPPFMKKLQYMMAGGIPLGYIVNLAMITGGGKTTITNEMIYYWIFSSPHRMGILSLELNAGQYQADILSRHIGKNLRLIEDPQEAVAFVKQDWVLEKREELRWDEYGRERYAIVDERDGNLDKVKLQIEKLIKKHGCKLIVIDPVNDLFEGVSIEEQTSFLKYMKAVIKAGITFFCVCHITKGKTEVDKKTGKRVMRLLTEDDFAGVSNLVKSGGCNMGAMRDKYSDDPIEQNTTYPEVFKCRWSGRSGSAGAWYFASEERTMYDLQDWLDTQEENLREAIPEDNDITLEYETPFDTED